MNESPALPAIAPEVLQALSSAFAQGRAADAERIARELAKQQPGLAFAWDALGGALWQQGRALDAIEPWQRAVALSPGSADALANLGLALRAVGRASEAEHAYRQAVHFAPQSGALRCSQGLALQDLGRLDEAEGCYREAVRIDAGDAAALNHLGVLLQRLDRTPEAEACLRRSIGLRPDYAEAHNNLGALLQESGATAEAEDCFYRCLQLRPGYPRALLNLGASLRARGETVQAEAFCRHALQADPGLAEAHFNLGAIEEQRGQMPAAAAHYRRALALRPSYAIAARGLGSALQELGDWEGAERQYRDALAGFEESAPSTRRERERAGTLVNLGTLYQDRGELAAARGAYGEALQAAPDSFEALSDLLFLSCCDNTPDAQALELAHRYGELATRAAAKAYDSWRCPANAARLRIGFVSGDLREHPVGHFLENLLAQIDPGRVECLAFPTTPMADALTERLRPRFSVWQPIAGRSDAQAAADIHAQGVHLLFDLAGHTAHNRLPVFAWRPAPVQVSWLGYFATTGLPQIDYFLADPWSLPRNREGDFTERVQRLPHTRLCFTAPASAPLVAPLPALVPADVTFCCFNNLTKVTDPVVALWSQLLRRLPRSRLFLKSKQLLSPALRETTLRRFAVHGIGTERLVLEGPSPRAEYLQAYHRADIALDPFPFTGATTSMEALWMGVPVLTLAGERLVARQGVSILANAGLDDWIARDEQDYLERAVHAAQDLPALARLRAGLRARLCASPMLDGAGFAREFESAVQTMRTATGAPRWRPPPAA